MPKDPTIPSENQEVKALATWLDAHDYLFTHVPLGGLREKKTASILKAMGAKSGVPDLLIFDQPTTNGVGKQGFITATGTAVEMKRRDGKPSDVSEDQHKWLRRLKDRGWATLVCYGAKDAKKQLIELGY